MRKDTTMLRSLNAVRGRTGYDAACKRVLSEKYILANIMKACLSEYHAVDIQEIAERYIEGTPQVSAVPVLPDEENAMINGMDTEDKSVSEGTITYDIRFRALLPASDDRISPIINVEAQNNFYPGYPLIKRGVYYCSRMISAQYGREFVGAHYEKIKKVYSIWICMHPPKNRENTITRYCIKEEQIVGKAEEPPKNYDLISVIMLCPGKPEAENYGGILRLLDVLFSNKSSFSEKRRILQEDYNIPMTRKIEQEVSDMCNLSEGIWEQGRAEGITEGLLASIKVLSKNMGVSVERAMSLLEIPAVEQKKYVELLDRQ